MVACASHPSRGHVILSSRFSFIASPVAALYDVCFEDPKAQRAGATAHVIGHSDHLASALTGIGIIDS